MTGRHRPATAPADDPWRPRPKRRAPHPRRQWRNDARAAQLSEPRAWRHQDWRRQSYHSPTVTVGHAAVDRDREPGDPRGAQPEHVHGPDRRHRDLHGARLRHLRRVRREHHGAELRHEQQRQRLLRVFLGHDRQPQHPGRSQFHPRQRERRQQLRAQRLRGGHRDHVSVQPPRRAASRGRRQQPEGPLGRAGRPLQLDRALQPPAGSGARGGQLAGARRSALPRDVRLRERDHRAPQQRQQRHLLLRRRRRVGPEVPEGNALLLRQHRHFGPHGQHAALPHGDQRREHRRAQQHRLRDGGGGQPAGARQLRPADADPELVQDGMDAIRDEQAQGHHHQQRHRHRRRRPGS